MADVGGSPPYMLLEAARRIWRGQGKEAVPLLVALVLAARSSGPLALATLYNELAEAHLARDDEPTAIMPKQKSVQVHEEQDLFDRIPTTGAEATWLSAVGGDGPAGHRA